VRRARIPADVEREDRVLAGLSGRQLVILAATAFALWSGYAATRRFLPPVAFGALAAPLAAAAGALALGRADGLSLDRLARAAFRQVRAPQRLVPAPGGLPAVTGSRKRPRLGPLPAPVRLVAPDGAVDLGDDGLRRLCRASAVSFALRSDDEQDALLAAFGRFLNGLSSPAEIVVGAARAELGSLATQIEEAAPSLPDPALEQAAREHGRFLRELDATGGYYGGDVLVVLSARPGPGAADHLARQLDEARSSLAGAGVVLAPLSCDETVSALAAAADPTAPQPPAGSSRAGIVRRTP
jgi:hypothetical protein